MGGNLLYVRAYWWPVDVVRACTCGVIAVAFVSPVVISTVTVVCIEKVNVFVIVAS